MMTVWQINIEKWDKCANVDLKFHDGAILSMLILATQL